MKVPADIYERVLELTTDMVNSTDTRSNWTLYGELSDYCDLIAAAGRDHPFLWETLADFTTDDRTSIHIYLRALGLATAVGATEYEASICLALAERHSNLGEASVAYDYAARANELAAQMDDLDLRQDISQFLLDHSNAPAGT